MCGEEVVFLIIYVNNSQNIYTGYNLLEYMSLMKITFATTNKHKLFSANYFLDKLWINVEWVSVEVDEIQNSDPIEVVIDKVKKSHQQIQKPIVAMDSWIFIEWLWWFPWVNTKYAMKTIKEDWLIELCKWLQNRSAYVQRTIAYTDWNIIKTFYSRWYGEIILEKRWTNWYNYDTVFFVADKWKTLAEMSSEEKVIFWWDSWTQFGKWYIENL